MFEQFLKSLSWRLTAPVRWLKAWLTGSPQSAEQWKQTDGHPPLQLEESEQEQPSTLIARSCSVPCIRFNYKLHLFELHA